MKKTTRQNLFLLLIVALLTAGLYLVKQQNEQDKEIRLPIHINELQTISIQHTSKIELEKRNDQWFMLSPKQGLIKPERIEKILTHLMLPLEGGFRTKDYALYSLDTPRMTVYLNAEPLTFGSLNTMQQMHYIMFRDEIYLARPFLQISFDKSASDLLLVSNEKNE